MSGGLVGSRLALLRLRISTLCSLMRLMSARGIQHEYILRIYFRDPFSVSVAVFIRAVSNTPFYKYARVCVGLIFKHLRFFPPNDYAMRGFALCGIPIPVDIGLGYCNTKRTDCRVVLGVTKDRFFFNASNEDDFIYIYVLHGLR